MFSTAQAQTVNPYAGSYTIYKLCTLREGDSFQKTGVFKGNKSDQRDGFIHLSHAHQVERIARKYYLDEAIVLLHIPLHLIEDSLRWELNSTGNLFPHLYKELKIEHIQESQKIMTQEFDFIKLA